MIRVMCCDYGFRTGSGRLYQDMYGEVPDNVFAIVSVGGSGGWRVGQKQQGMVVVGVGGIASNTPPPRLFHPVEVGSTF